MHGMWVGEVLDDNHQVYEQYLLRGPSIKIGRSVENSMVFAADKSISRVHADITVDASNGLVHITDLASRYGSSINGVKLQPNTPVNVEHGAIARFGVGSIRVRFVRKQYNFCATRLEKPEKDKLKRNAKLIGGRVVSQVEHATHVVTNKAAATVKLLVALVAPLKLVRLDWLNFVDTDKPAVLIPKEQEFVPHSTEEVALKDPQQSRRALLVGYTVFLVQAQDLQYASVCSGCGATVIACWKEEEEKGLSTLQVVTDHIAQQQHQEKEQGVDRRYCFFFDESRGIECDKILMDECREAISRSTVTGRGAAAARGGGAGGGAGAVSWLTAGQLAAAVITLAAPILFTDPPKASRVAVAGSFASQSQFSGLHSQLASLPVPAPAAGVGKVAAVPSAAPPAAVGASRQASTAAHSAPTGSARPQILVGQDGADHIRSAAEAVKPPVQPAGPAAAVLTAAQKVDDSTSAQSKVAANEALYEAKPAADTGSGVGRKRKPVLPAHDWDAEEAEREGERLIANAAADPSVEPQSKRSRGRPQPSVAADSDLLPPVATSKPAAPKLTTAVNNSDLFGLGDDELFSEADVIIASSNRSAVPSSQSISAASLPVPGAQSAAAPVPVSVPASAPEPAPSKRGRAAEKSVAVPAVSSASLTDKPAPRPSRVSAVEQDHDGAEWIKALRGSERDATVRENRDRLALARLQVESGDGDVGEGLEDPVPLSMVPAEAVEKVSLLSTDRGFYGEVTLHGPGRAAAAGEAAGARQGGPRNVKVFRKNAVRSVGGGQRMSFTAMQVVLPKESEREIQLRLEAEARREMEEFADHMMSDKFTAGAVRRKV